MHSFGMSKDFIVILEQPLFVDKTATNGINLHHHLKWKAHLPVSKIPIAAFLLIFNNISQSLKNPLKMIYILQN